MTEAIKWSEQLEVGVEKFDLQHRKLIDMLNEFYDAMRRKSERAILIKIVKGLIEYTMEHFRDEEQALFDVNYPELEIQKSEHEKLRREVNTFMQRYRDDEVSSYDFFEFLKNWIINHVLVTDKKYKEYLENK
jgi:hemerythrin